MRTDTKEELLLKDLLLDVLNLYIKNHYALLSSDILNMSIKIDKNGHDKDGFINSLDAHEKALFYTALQQMSWTEWDVIFDVYNEEEEKFKRKMGYYLLHELEKRSMENLSSEE